MTRRRRSLPATRPGRPNTLRSRLAPRSSRPSSSACSAGADHLPEHPLELVDRRQPGGDLLDAVRPQRLHAVLEGALLERVAVRPLHSQAPERLVHEHQLVDADPALVALAAVLAATLAVERHALR